MSVEMWAAVAGLAVILPAVFLYNRLVADRNLARQYLTRIETFPDLVVARLLAFRPMPFFEL